MSTHTPKHTYIHSYTHTYILAYTHKFTHIFTHTYTYLHSHLHTHTYTHTYILTTTPAPTPQHSHCFRPTEIDLPYLNSLNDVLHNIQQLNLFSCKLKCIAALRHLKSLKHLTLCFNDLERLDDLSHMVCISAENSVIKDTCIYIYIYIYIYILIYIFFNNIYYTILHSNS